LGRQTDTETTSTKSLHVTHFVQSARDNPR
jgi:hypothetical protein